MIRTCGISENIYKLSLVKLGVYTFFYEVLQMPALLIRYDQLGPLVGLEPHALQGVVLDELNPGIIEIIKQINN